MCERRTSRPDATGSRKFSDAFAELLRVQTLEGLLGS
jgi:hypothetical protein